MSRPNLQHSGKRPYTWHRVRRETRNIVCLACRQLGHDAVDCPEEKARLETEERERLKAEQAARVKERDLALSGILEAPRPPRERERPIFGRRDELKHLRRS